jgi:multiple sugar transport system substrate-binding protein/putative aldouronate transport system substrate-binding protein
MAIINWMATPEGVMTYNYGPKGLTWNYDKDGNPVLTELGETVQKNGDTEMSGGYTGKWTDGTSKINNTTWSIDAKNPDAKKGDTYNYKFWTTRQALPVTTVEQDWRTKTGATNLNVYLEKNKQMAISLGTSYSSTPMSNELTTTWNQVKQAIVTGSWKAIYAKSDAEFNTLVSDMTKQANSYGYADCTKFQQNEAAIRKGLEDKIRNK